MSTTHLEIVGWKNPMSIFNKLRYISNYEYEQSKFLNYHSWENDNILCLNWYPCYGSLIWVNKQRMDYYSCYCTYKPSMDDEIIHVYKINGYYEHVVFIDKKLRYLFSKLLVSQIRL